MSRTSCVELDAAGHSVSGVVEDGCASISEIDFRGFPTCAGGLVPEFGRVGWGFVIVGWNPGTDGLPGRFDGLKSLIRPPRLASSPCGLRVDFASLALRAASRQSVSLRATRLRPKHLRSLGVFRCRKAARAVELDQPLMSLSLHPSRGFPPGSLSPLRFGSHKPRRRSKNSTSPRRRMVSTRFIVPWQQGHLRRSAPQTLRMRSRQSGRVARAVVARAVVLGGAGMRRISGWGSAAVFFRRWLGEGGNGFGVAA